MYDLVAYGQMIADRGRMSAYARALEAAVTPGAVVLDIGSGPGILALLACRAGAARVYAIEPSNVIDVAREIAAANGFADRIRFIQGISTACDLPEPVDGIVSDLHGVLPLYRNAVVSILDARDRLLKQGGWLIPARETLWAAVVTSPAAHAQVVSAWDTEYGFDLSPARRRTANLYRGRRADPTDLLSSPQCWATLEYGSLRGPAVSGDVSCLVDRDGIGHGIAMWFDAELTAGIGLSNSPLSSEPHVYSQAFFPWPEAAALSAGDSVRLGLRADLVGDDYVWTWSTDVSGPPDSPSVKASFRQSSFFAETVSPKRLRKRAHTFVAEPNDDSRIDRHILDLMERKVSLGEIATELLSDFPGVFRNREAAMDRVAVLSDRYGR